MNTSTVEIGRRNGMKKYRGTKILPKKIRDHVRKTVEEDNPFRNLVVASSAILRKVAEETGHRLYDPQNTHLTVSYETAKEQTQRILKENSGLEAKTARIARDQKLQGSVEDEVADFANFLENVDRDYLDEARLDEARNGHNPNGSIEKQYGGIK